MQTLRQATETNHAVRSRLVIVWDQLSHRGKLSEGGHIGRKSTCTPQRFAQSLGQVLDPIELLKIIATSKLERFLQRS